MPVGSSVVLPLVVGVSVVAVIVVGLPVVVSSVDEPEVEPSVVVAPLSPHAVSADANKPRVR